MHREAWFRIGHATYEVERSGCTAIVFDQLVPAAVDVRGGAPGTRETTLLEPGSIGMLDAILLSGGSAFGLQAAEGVMRYLAQRGRGVTTRAGAVPLVSSAIIFDLATGTNYYPTAQDGYDAAEAATNEIWKSGPIGAGTGATVAKLGGQATPGGFGIASVSVGSFEVTAVLILNAVGDVRHPSTGEWLAQASERNGRQIAIAAAAEGHEHENTTVGAVLVTGDLDRRTLIRCCISAQAALARCTIPAHTLLDGDTFFAASSGAGSPTVREALAITSAVEVAVEEAIVSIFRSPST
jgi:L-aminopeptidase/D-esterase-like protein